MVAAFRNKPVENPIKHLVRTLTLLAAGAAAALCQSQIPAVAWHDQFSHQSRQPAKQFTGGNIDDSYWQGAPVGGIGAGTSRSGRALHRAWHPEPGVDEDDVDESVRRLRRLPEGGLASRKRVTDGERRW